MVLKVFQGASEGFQNFKGYKEIQERLSATHGIAKDFRRVSGFLREVQRVSEESMEF